MSFERLGNTGDMPLPSPELLARVQQAIDSPSPGPRLGHPVLTRRVKVAAEFGRELDAIEWSGWQEAADDAVRRRTQARGIFDQDRE